VQRAPDSDRSLQKSASNFPVKDSNFKESVNLKEIVIAFFLLTDFISPSIQWFHGLLVAACVINPHSKASEAQAERPMALRALPLAKQVELAQGRLHPSFARHQAARLSSEWLICFVSFTMLLLISWSASQPGQVTTTFVVLLFLAPWSWIVIRKPSEAFRSIFQNWILVALPLLSLVSTLWSDYPAVSLKGGAQYLVTTFIGILAGYCIKPRILMSALLSALAFLAIVSILDGNRSYNIYTGEYTLIGVFGSKNYFALCISLLLLTAAAAALDRSQMSTFRILGIASVFLAAPLLVYARSVGALVVSISALAISILLQIIWRFTVASRIALIISTLLGAALVGTAATMEIQYVDILNYFGKDVSLTGRTLLWEHAAAAIADRPILGGGYEAFWQVGNSSAEQLWYYSYVPNKYGYHFHNTFLQIIVDLGFVGLGVFLIVAALIVVRMLAVLLSRRPSSEQIFAMTIFMFFLLRMPLEVDLFFQFQLASVLICVIWIYMRRPSLLAEN
jgi:exopolysaccharide production protein ExoQ